jgi:hypothetical protein
MIRTLRTLPLLALAALGLLAAPAAAGVDVAVGNGDKVTGTLLPADEVESYRVLVPAGAVFKLKVKGKPAKKGDPKPPVTLRLFDPQGNLAAQGIEKKTSATLKGYRAEETGEYRIQVQGDGNTSGNYQLVVKWKSPKSFRFDVDDPGPGDPSLSELPLDAGATLTIKLKAAKGSEATPVAERLTGASDFERDLPAPNAGATSHTVKKQVVPVFGAATLQSSGGGPYSVSVKVKPPKPAKRKIDLTQKVLGSSPTGGDVAFGQVVGPGGGEVAVSVDDSAIIGGSGVDIPAGALSTPTAVLVGTSTPMPTQEDGDQPAGPTVFFGPEGLTFQQDVTVTIPFDVEAFAANAGELSVFTRDEDGNITEITEFTVDLDTGTCSFQVSHFSSFRVYGPALPPPVEGDLDVDGAGDLVLRAPGNGAGRVYVVPGGSTAGLDIGTTAGAPIVLTGEGVSGRFGEIVATSDLNQDGREDLIVTAPQAGLNGRVYVFFGDTAFASRGAETADLVFTGQSNDLGFGVRLAVGDANGDGVEDLVIGAEGSSAGVAAAGAAYVFFGAPELSSRSAAFADVVLTGTTTNDGFGASVGVGDVTDDGFPDVIVGADQVVRNGTGALYVFAGGPGLKSQKASKADFTAFGVAARDGFGLETAVGDVTGDGVDDIVVSAAGDDEAATDAGAVYVFRGGSLASAPSKLTGEGAGDDFGFNVAVRDLDGSPGAEVVVTAERVAGGRGRAYVFSGGAGFGDLGAASAAAIYTGESSGDNLSVLQLPWDATGDGTPDLLVYAPRAASEAGRAYVLPGGSLPASGSVASAATVVISGQAGEALGGVPSAP